MNLRLRLIAAACALLPATLVAQQDPRAQLEARGLPAELAAQVARIAADATAQGLPAAPILDKAIEGFAKHAPADRISAALTAFAARMLTARDAVREAAAGSARGDVIAAAAEAMGRGIAAAQVETVVRAAPAPALAAPGLTVTAALAGQGMAADQAVAVVVDAMHKGRDATQILDLPSVARAMQARGLSADEAGRRILRGGDAPPLGPGGPMGPDGRGAQPGAPPPPPPPGGIRPPPGSGGGVPPRHP